MTAPQELPWLEPGEPFPEADLAWGSNSEAPGLLAAGGDLSVGSLQRAYSQGIFPWFSAGQPILWWSTDPRMVLKVSDFKLHRSLRKTLKKFSQSPDCQIRMDSDFAQVINTCAGQGRAGQNGTWIVPPMVKAYQELHRSGYAHSVETWINGELCGGLYCVSLGRAVFGESMFSTVSDASKIALSALVAFCRTHAIEFIDCQQNTRHLASLGAAEVPRSVFLSHVRHAQNLAPPLWNWDPLYWLQIFDR